MTALNIIWAIVEALFVIYHMGKSVKFIEWNSLFVVFWVVCFMDSLNKLGAFK